MEAPTDSGDFELTDLRTIIRQNGSDGQALQQPAAGNVFGQFLTEVPAFMRHTLDWLSTSLSKGMSRDGTG